ncbi:peroxisomal assembly protein [Puccinia graminis f. sp. tritici]|uniref:Peroxisomal ATPase PEX6 n=1 Tax=Puccinia graminis f. sp. tritici TaxID=56615 RepID=A0A5B0S6A9_PUCGR|nr:peroxisomal assembly protein [Puccinia graminis f. sp. tritici]
MNSLSVELKPVNLDSYFSSTSPSIHRKKIDEVLLISSRLRAELLFPPSQTKTDLIVSLTNGHSDSHRRSIILSTQTELFGQVEPELELELEKLGRWIDQEEEACSPSSAARFLVYSSHALFGQIQSTLQLDPTHHPQHLLHLSPAQAIPLSAVLLELIDPTPDSFSIESPEFQAELKSQLSLLPRIIRQSELLQVYLPSFPKPGLNHDNDNDNHPATVLHTHQHPQPICRLSFNVLLTEPVLQGVFLPTQTLLTIVAKAHPSAQNPLTPTSTTANININGTAAETINNDPVRLLNHHPVIDALESFELAQEEDDLEIDLDFLAHSVLNQPLVDLSSYPQSTSSLGHPCHGLPLLESPHQPDTHSLGLHPNEDDGFHCFARMVDLMKIGVQSGDWLLLTKSCAADHGDQPISSSDPHQHRLVRIIGCDDDHPAILNFRQHHPQFDSQPSRQAPALILVPPVLLLNLLGTISYSAAVRSLDLNRPAPLSALAASLPSHLSHSALPTIRSLTLARLASPQALTKSYQPSFLRALKKYFEQKARVLLDGDVIAIAIDGDSARFTESHPSQSEPSADELDPDHFLPSSLVSYPTLPIYFKVTNLELSYPTLDQAQPNFDHGHQDSAHGSSAVNQTNQTNPLLPIRELMEDGVLGGIVDPKITKLVQTGLEFGFVPDAKNWLGIDSSTPLFYSPHSATNSQSPERMLYEYLLAAARVESRNYDLNLTVLISGPRGCGKSTLTKRAVDATGFNFLELNCFDLLGETEVKTAGTLRARFERALQAIPCVLLLRHLDGLARKSQSLETGQQPGIIAILKECFNEARRNWTCQSAVKFPLIIVGTTTDPDLLPLSMLALFKTQLAIEAPSEAERLEIIKELLRKDSLAPDVSLKSIALETAGLVANDLVHLVAQARMAAVTRARKHATGIEQLAIAGIQLMAKDIEKALGKARSEYSESIGAPRIPKVSWDDIGGLAKVREEILETVQLPIQHPELFANGLKRRSGLLLYGPPGTGKTLLAKAVATSCGLNFFSVKGPELLNMYIGESEANVRRVFERARGARPCVIFFDELDSVAPKRGNQGDSGGVMDRIVSQLLAELDGISSGSSSNDNQQEGATNGSGNGEVVVIGATNRPDLLDPALLRPGRFDKLIYLGIPTSRDQKLEILKSLTRKFNLSSSFDFDWLIDQVDRIGSQKGSGNIFTGADFYSICSEALMASLIRKIERLEAMKSKRSLKTDDSDDLDRPNDDEHDEEIEGSITEVDKEDFMVALKQVKPSISASELAHYRIIQDQFSDSTRQNLNQAPRVKSNGYHTNDVDNQQTIQFDFSPSKNKGKSKEIN